MVREEPPTSHPPPPGAPSALDNPPPSQAPSHPPPLHFGVTASPASHQWGSGYTLMEGAESTDRSGDEGNNPGQGE